MLWERIRDPKYRTDTGEQTQEEESVTDGVKGLLERVRRPNPILSHRVEYALALLFSLSSVLGIFLDRGISLAGMNAWQALLWLGGSLALTEGVRRFERLLCGVLSRWAGREAEWEGPSGNSRPEQRKRFLREKPLLCFLFCLAVILFCWLPVWLAYFPGLWNYDPWQANQVITGEYSKHHPLLHTLLLGNCYRFALERGNADLAPMLYTALQGGFCAAVYALSCTMIRRKTRSTVFFVLSLLFFALFPVHPILAMSTTKDTLFSAMILLAGLLFLFMEGADRIRKRWLAAAEVAVLALIALFRNNGKYCLALLIVLCLFRLKKKQWRGMLAILMAGTALGFGADWALGKALKTSPAEMAEMCSVPSQMMGRVKQEIPELDEETTAFLNEFYSLGEMEYNPYLADGTKWCLRLESRADLVEYGKGSVRLFLKYPLIGIDSLLYTTEGLWNLWDVSHSRIYGVGHGMGYLTTDIQSWFQIEEDSRIPGLKALYEKLLSDNEYQKIPVLRLLFAPALYAGLLLLALCVMRRDRKQVWIVIPLFLLFLVFTIVAGPGILPRYVYPLMTCAPLLIWMLIKSAAVSESGTDDLA